MSYSALQAPTDLFAVNSALRSRAFPLNGEHRRDSDSHSPMSEPRSPLFRPSLTAEISPHLASLYNSPYAAAAVAAVVAGQGSAGFGASPAFNPYGRIHSAAAFYPHMVSGDAWRRASYLPQMDFCWPPGLRGLEAVVGPRTKAPREATSILKSWLNEHKDNPYPTKSEKMTLALVTHMTLTQVSTWFANARRRIKKENKMTWTPKTRCGEKDGSSSNEEESEKDYFGRQNSPFAMRRAVSSGDASVQQSSGDFKEQKGSLRYDGSASSSNPFNPDMPRKGPVNPLFAAFSGIQPPYAGLNRSSLEDAFRQRMLGTQNDITLEKRREEFPSPFASSDKGRSFHSSNAETHDARRSPPELSTSNRTFPVIANHGASQLMGNRRPFIHLKQDGSPGDTFYNKNDFTKGNKEESPEETTDVVTKRDVDDASEPFPVANQTEKSEHTSRYTSDKDSDRPKSRDEQQPFLQKSAMLSSYRPIYVEGDLLAKSASNGKMDALSCWIRDFQHLVASGQEIKAKQALATALAVAAKVGGYSGMDSVQRPSPHCNPHTPPQHVERRFSSDGSPIIGSRLEGRRSPISYNRSFRFPQMKGIKGDDVKTSTLDMGTRRSTSPNTPPANSVRLRSPYKRPTKVADDAPINLSMPAPVPVSNDWKSRNLAVDGGRIEA